ncbi:MAG: hypothetical protein LBD29_05580, partial [Treponema sp.]|nr:hypothetical protein [Treponema sp.]
MPSFRTVWATLQEAAEARKIMEADFDRRTAEAQRRSEALDQQMAETDRKIKELAEEHQKTELVAAAMSKRVDKMAENLGGLNRSMGELIE